MRESTRRVRWVYASACVAIVLAGALTVIPRAPASDKSAEATQVALPPDLARVAPDALYFLSVQVASLWNQAAVQPIRNSFAEQFPELLRQFEKTVGTALGEIERLTVVFVLPRMPNSRQPSILFYVVTTRPYDAKKLLGTLVPGAKEEIRSGQRLQVAGRKAVYAINDRNYVVGDTGDIQSIVDRGMVKEAGPLTPALRLAAGQHVAVFGGNPQRILKFEDPAVQQFLPLFEARSVAGALDVDETVHGFLRFSYEGSAKAKEGAAELRALLVMTRQSVDQDIKQVGRDMTQAKTVAFLNAVKTALERTKVETNGNDVQVAVKVKADLGLYSAYFAEMGARSRGMAERQRSINNLRQIGIAMNVFHDGYRRFPPAANYDTNGKPLLSWRVFLLPQLHEEALYKQFHLDEPWDSEHNKKLLDKMPAVYAAPGGKAKRGETFYQGFHGKGAFFDGKKGLPTTEFTDGTSNTIMIVEAATPVPWTKPEDLPFDPDKPMGKIGFRPDGFLGVLCDGSARLFDKHIKPETLRLLIGRNNGVPAPGDF